MHAKPDLRVFLKWMIARSGSVITDVIPLEIMNKDLRIVTNQVFLLGLDELYRTAMKRHESAELLECARNVASTLGVAPADVPIEGYYTESSELTEYFQLVRSLQDQPIDRETELPESEPYSRLVAVTSCLLYTSPSPRDLSTSRMPSSA